jgi:hypothetical protein
MKGHPTNRINILSSEYQGQIVHVFMPKSISSAWWRQGLQLQKYDVKLGFNAELDSVIYNIGQCLKPPHPI